jgi:hypothetical protein
MSTAAGDRVNALMVIGQNLYVGGIFTTAGGVTANNVAHWDGSAWASLGTGGDNGVNCTVSVLNPLGTSLYVGGTFTQAGTQISSDIVSWQSDDLFADGFEAF